MNEKKVYDRCMVYIKKLDSELSNIKFSCKRRSGDIYLKAGLFNIRLDIDLSCPVVYIKHGAISIEIANQFIEFNNDLNRTMCPSYKQFYCTDLDTDVNLYEIKSEEEFFQSSLINEFGCFEFSDIQFIYKLRDDIINITRCDETILSEFQLRNTRR